ncbi:mucin-5AC-like isoform X2 [Physella acuta]|uniref:mucin-5AC-like isoform X2 n=1 Tax=Physella acuta TaxID=109671 RepID=UPI0027DB67F7|nr:mucin-5AC-like isoform X2 [Physella acuta]
MCQNAQSKAQASKNMSIGENSKAMAKRPGKRPGRKPSKIDERAKLERSRQSARECRARKKLRYQYLEELVLNREKAVFALRDELETCKQWCALIDSGGPVPESLLKAIIDETSSQNQREGNQTRRHDYPHSGRFSSPNSSSSSSSSPPMMLHRESYHSHAGSSSYQQHLPKLSPPLQQQLPAQRVTTHQDNQLTQLPARHVLSGPPTLQRQMAFDFSNSPIQNSPDSRTITQPASTKPLMVQLSARPETSTRLEDILEILPSVLSPRPTTTSHPLSQRVRSEPPFVYNNPNILPSYKDIETSEFHPQHQRSQSFSIPLTLASELAQLNPTTTNIASYPRTSQNYPYQSELGLFSGKTVSSEIPTTITIEDSSSSDENINEQHLFLSQKRPATQPVFRENPKRFIPASVPDMTSSPFSMYDPQTTLNNLTTVHCYSSTRTSNSPSPYSMSPSSGTSPTPNMRFTGKATPTSSSRSSPDPLSSASSIPNFLLSSIPTCTSSVPSSSSQTLAQCSSTGLTASIAEPIPEWYSFLADLQDSGLAMTSRHGASSSHSTPLAMTPRPNDQPLTPDPSLMNVPNIIDEFLSPEDQNL